ncbi:hypothetical protein RIF29_16447 [Crotalaria pallida]|uniref:Uncharacterized protein n=1 Tax=Crotalaria pallida TaxID=3830 RepID=A0AAN9IEG8_CROPI
MREKEELEALKQNQAMMNSSILKGKSEEEEEEEEEVEKTKSMWDCGSPLYDSYELVSLDHVIDRNLMAFPSSLHGSKPIITTFNNHHSHDMLSVSGVVHKVVSPEKSKGSFLVTSFSKLRMKIRKKTLKKKEHEKSHI